MAAEIFKAAIFNFEMGEKNEHVLHTSTVAFIECAIAGLR